MQTRYWDSDFVRINGPDEKGLTIEVDAPESKEEYSRNHSFWLDFFGHLSEFKVEVNKNVACRFFYEATGAAPAPKTLVAKFLDAFGLYNVENATVIKEMDVENVNLASQDITALKNGWVSICFEKSQAERFKILGMKFQVIMLPIQHPYRMFIQAGQIRRLVLGPKNR